MSNDLLEKALRSIMSECAGGAPLKESDPTMVGIGPCPHCRHRIEPTSFMHQSAASGRGKELCVCIIVCGGCRKAVMSKSPGKYEAIPRKLLRGLPKATLRWIRRNQEFYETHTERTH